MARGRCSGDRCGPARAHGPTWWSGRAAALGTAAIVVDAVAAGGYGLLPLDAIRGVSIATSRGDLSALLTARLNGAHDAVPSPDDPVLAGYIGALDGEAAARIAKLIDVT